jgi:hypothetical protein
VALPERPLAHSFVEKRRVVHQDIDVSAFAPDPVEKRSDLVIMRHVARNCDAVATSRRHLSRDLMDRAGELCASEDLRLIGATTIMP